MVKVGVSAFEVMVTLPLAFATDCGVKVTLKLALCPAVSVTGAVIPVTVNPVPLTPTWEMVTLEPPVLVTVSDTDWLLPTITLPKFSLAGLSANWPLATPVPVSERVAELLEALLVRENAALKAPAALGANTSVIGALWPAKIAIGRVGALSEKYWLEIEALLTAPRNSARVELHYQATTVNLFLRDSYNKFAERRGFSNQWCETQLPCTFAKR
jgi:hypothetical protein